MAGTWQGLANEHGHGETAIYTPHAPQPGTDTWVVGPGVPAMGTQASVSNDCAASPRGKVLLTPASLNKALKGYSLHFWTALLLTWIAWYVPSVSADPGAPSYVLYTGPQQVTSVNGGGCWDAPLPQPTSGSWLLQQFPCNAGSNQFWTFSKLAKDSQGRDIVVIHSNMSDGNCLDLPWGNTTTGIRVQLFSCHGGMSQQWIVNNVDSQTITLMPNANTLQCLDVANAVRNAQAAIQLFPCKSNTDPGRTNQEWRLASLPQGLTGGVAHVNHDCEVNVLAIARLAGAAIGPLRGVIDCAGVGGCVNGVVSGVNGIVNAISGTNFLTCGPPNVFRSGGVAAVGAASSVQTLLLDPGGGNFTVQAANGWLTQSDGDFGNGRNFGFYHQEITAPGGGVTDLSVSEKFKLPRGTACGFHHTSNTPYNYLAGRHSTCMGQDPASGQCPRGWMAKSHFDMSSDTGYFVWCEYQDPHGLCDNDPKCIASVRAGGFAIGISSDTDANGVESGGGLITTNPPAPGVVPCPIGFSRTAFFDDGRGAGWGLSWCWPIPDLPQGLTGGVAYRSGPYAWIATSGSVLGTATISTSNGNLGNGDGFAVRNDGDLGMSSGLGFYHQELVSGGTTDLRKSASFALLPGAACGFHHTQVSPALTCMGLNPANGSCPNGWVARKHFDMSSGNGYWAWCEYQDPNGLCAFPNTSDCVAKATYIGYTTGISSNTDSGGNALANGGVCPAANTPNGWRRTSFFDAGRSTGQGLSWCMP